MTDPTTILEARIDPKVKTYFLVNTAVPLLLTVVLAPLLIIIIPIGIWAVQKYLDNLSVTLTERTLEIKKGVLTRIESTIPLEKITDLQMVQGPIMKWFGIHSFKVETAGSTGPAGALIMVTGIVDAPEFRKAVLAQRDRQDAKKPATEPASPEGVAGTAAGDGVLIEIRDSLLRIEQQLRDQHHH
ncbi:MAG: PH domain-containing protein [Planctomycetota bacterium]